MAAARRYVSVTCPLHPQRDALDGRGTLNAAGATYKPTPRPVSLALPAGARLAEMAKAFPMVAPVAYLVQAADHVLLS